MKAQRWFWLAWAAALAATWLARPLLPPDELRYLSVSWEMRETGSLLVPMLNGETYSHKPPLLFWAHQAGWALFGVNAWWPRLLQAAGAALGLLVLARLTRALAPHSASAPACALLLFGGGLMFQIYSGSILFDLWLSVFVFLAWLGLARACPPAGGAQPAPGAGWTIFALATAGAILTKGPAALISILPPALLLPLWSGPVARRGSAWLGLGLALLAAVALALAWAIPAARAGGADYGNAILYGQTAGRLRDSFAHARPFWWYLALLPALTLPWCLWPALWRRPRAEASPDDGRALRRFGLCAFTPALLLFSAVSGKQPHYLFPALGGLALFAAARLTRSAALAAGAARMLTRLALVGPAFVLVAHLALWPLLVDRYSLQEAATAVAEAQAAGRPAAFFGAKYHGQFHFLGRLHAPVDNPESPKAQRDWLAEHPDGLVALLLAADSDPRLRAEALHVQKYGTRQLALWRARDLAPLLKK